MVASSTIEADLIARIISSEKATFSPDAARSILGLEFQESDLQRMHDLAEKKRQGELSDDELDEMHIYMRVGNFLSILKSKARQSISSAETE